MGWKNILSSNRKISNPSPIIINNQDVISSLGGCIRDVGLFLILLGFILYNIGLDIWVTGRYPMATYGVIVIVLIYAGMFIVAYSVFIRPDKPLSSNDVWEMIKAYHVYKNEPTLPEEGIFEICPHCRQFASWDGSQGIFYCPRCSVRL